MFLVVPVERFLVVFQFQELYSYNYCYWKTTTKRSTGKQILYDFKVNFLGLETRN